jgi:hypothetical protein
VDSSTDSGVLPARSAGGTSDGLKTSYAFLGLGSSADGDQNMTEDVMQAAMTTWAAKDLPARLLAGQVAKLLNCSTEDVAILVSAGKLRALGRPKPNAVKFFSSIELITLLADHDWLDEVTKTISQHWRRKNARRNGLTLENQVEDALADVANLVKKTAVS